MKRTALGIVVAAIALGTAGLASAASTPAFKLGTYSGHTSQRCYYAGPNGPSCKPGARLTISFTVGRNYGQVTINNVRWTEVAACTPYNYRTIGTAGPLTGVVVKASGKFSYTYSQFGVTMHFRGRLRGKRASGTMNDVEHDPSGVICSSGTFAWSAATR